MSINISLNLFIIVLMRSLPVKRIASGYGYLESEDKRIVSVEDVNVGDNINIYLKDGKINTTVNNIDNVNILNT